MKKILASFLLIPLIVCFPLKTSPNAAMPGFYNTGGSGSFVPFFKKDSEYLDKIQMQSEEITIFLERGFAVVKGEYHMKNLTNEDITLQTGYPINSQYVHSQPYSVQFDDLYKLEVLVDGKKVKTKKIEEEQEGVYKASKLKYLDNWYTWQSIFKAKTTTHLTVYFIVNTNEAILRSGYNVDRHNGFTYILESGRAWAKDIEKGRVYIKLGEKIKVSDVLGISPIKKCLTDNKKQIIYDFENLEPDSSSNIIIRYDKKDKNFDFEKITKKAKQFYKKLDELSQKNISSKNFKVLKAHDFEVKDKDGNSFFIGISVLVFGLPALVIFGGLAFVIVLIYSRIKARKKR